jgi:hypothetical protein
MFAYNLFIYLYKNNIYVTQKKVGFLFESNKHDVF